MKYELQYSVSENSNPSEKYWIPIKCYNLLLFAVLRLGTYILTPHVVAFIEKEKRHLVSYRIWDIKNNIAIGGGTCIGKHK